MASFGSGFGVIGYFMKVLDQSEEIYNAEQNLHDAKNKEKHLKTNELEMINLSLELIQEITAIYTCLP